MFARVSRAAAIALALALSGCGDSPTAYDLTAATPSPALGLRAHVRVREPAAAANLDSDRLLVRTHGNAMAVLAGAAWTDRLPSLVQSRLIGSFQSAHGRSMVGGEAMPNPDYDLQCDIRDFELDAEAKRVRIEIVAKIVSARTGRVVATRAFKAESPVPNTEPATVIPTLDAALSGILGDIVRFTSASL